MQRQNPNDGSKHRNALYADTNDTTFRSIPIANQFHVANPCACNTSIAIVKIQWPHLHSMLMTSS